MRVRLLPGVPQTVTLHSAGFSNLQPPYTKAQASKASHHMRAWRGALARSSACRQRRGAGAGGAAQRQDGTRMLGGIRHGRAAATRAAPAWVPPEPPAPGEMPLAQ